IHRRAEDDEVGVGDGAGQVGVPRVEQTVAERSLKRVRPPISAHDATGNAAAPRRQGDGAADQSDADNGQGGDTHTESVRFPHSLLLTPYSSLLIPHGTSRVTETLGHFAGDAVADRLVAQAVIAAGENLDDRIAAQLRQRFLQLLYRSFKIEGVRAA